MDKVLHKAEHKAVAALKERIQRSDRNGHLSNPKERRYWKEKYKRELWTHAFEIADCKAIDQTDHMCEARQSITEILECSLPYSISMSKNSLWTTIRLKNSSYIISESEDGLLLSAGQPAPHMSRLLPDEAAALIMAYDNHIADADMIVEDTLKEYMAEKKSMEVLQTTASAILSDILANEHNVWFNISLQKNGRLCCRVVEYAEWLPGKTFRTDWDNLRKDFTNALHDLRTRRKFGIEL